MADYLVVLTHLAHESLNHFLILRLARAPMAHSVTAEFQRRWIYLREGGGIKLSSVQGESPKSPEHRQTQASQFYIFLIIES